MKKLIIFLMIITMLSLGFSIVFAEENETDVLQGNAAQTVTNHITNKEQKIAEYTEKYGGDVVYGKTAYYLGVAQKYSIPICFIGLAIGAVNFFIIGNKKLEKKEQGFAMIVTFLLGLVVFQVLPLLFAIVVAGR